MGNKTNSVVHCKNLQLYLFLGMKLTKIHRALKFKQSGWMKKDIDFNTEKRTNAANSFEKDSFKACVLYFHQIFSPNDNPSKTMKNAFYFI